ncbi:hypothetical protein BofuT4_uP111090.1 [Botrytis cinerea T4]|uniref:Uncharacterized protein n=1 Tax=Botryotinia fuckeliana (strain T4) TaxID=999810 RepID=G2Y644_BOTF4|nr:hypothetical protein BofuT4_uP111090.1 [Botrytis cinerea T4]
MTSSWSCSIWGVFRCLMKLLRRAFLTYSLFRIQGTALLFESKRFAEKVLPHAIA